MQDDTVLLKNQGISSPTQAQMTDVYQWGYADVRVNGTAYGTAINPYASAASAESGGDGFDLSWAVDEDGVPHPMTSAKYIRVYSAVLFNAGVFGETSAEVCGLYRTDNVIANGAGVTAAPDVYINGNLFDLDEAESLGNNVYFYGDVGVYAQTTVAVDAPSTAKVFINGVAPSDFEANEGTQAIQILVQDGDSAPFILVIK